MKIQTIQMILFGMLVCLVSSCGEPNHIIDDPVTIARHRVIAKTARELQDKFNLHAIGIAGGNNRENKIRLIGIYFEYDNKVTKEEARKLLIESTQIFLDNIATDQDLQQYLIEQPYTYKNIELTIGFKNPDGSPIYHPDLGIISINKGITIYYTTTAEKPLLFESVIREPYEETLKLHNDSKKAE